MNRYIFIVGLPRTGTKLIRNVLRGSPELHVKLSQENFFLGHLVGPGVRDRLKKFGDLRDDANVSRLVDAMYAGKFAGTYWNSLKNGSLGIERERLLEALLACDRSDRAIYQVLLSVHPDVTAETVLGDKTPAHLYHVPTLLEWFPQAKVVHTFRDPRAILASEWRKRIKGQPPRLPLLKVRLPQALHSFAIVLHITLSWLYAVRLHYRYARRYPQNYYLSKFEDVVRQPEAHIKELCRFLEIDFDEAMLTPRQVGSSYEREKASGFDTQTLERWQQYLKPWMKTWLLLWGKKYLKDFGYIQ